IPCQVTWLADPVVAAKEVRKNAARGFRAVSFSENPAGLGFPSIYSASWDPFLEACEETETVVNLHVGSAGSVTRPSADSVEMAVVAMFPLNGIQALVEWVFAQIPLRFPKIKVALSEAGASWVPMALERLGRAERQIGSVGKDWPVDAPTPRELVHRNFFFTSIEDPSAFRLLDVIGEDNGMGEGGYRHSERPWHELQAMIRSELEGVVAPPVVRKGCYENACRVYRHPLPPDEMIAASIVGAAGEA